MSSKPTFVLVPGNFVPVTYYDPVANLLKSHGFPVELVSIPSTGSSVPLKTNEPDIVAVKKVLDGLLAAGKEIVVVAHSSGITPACEAVKGAGIQQRKKLGETGGVIKLIFVAAWLMQEGESPVMHIQKHKVETPWLRSDESSIYCEDADASLFTDTTPEVATYWKKHLTSSDIAAFGTPLQYAAWRDIPSTYLICAQDKCLPTYLQEELIKATDGKVKVEKMPSGHMPMLSMPEEFVDFLLGEAGRAG